MKKRLLNLLLIGGINTLIAQNVSIPDVNFKTYLTNNTAINTDGDSEISISEAQNFTGEIIIPSLSISDLTGIESFTNITVLDCYENSLNTLDVSNNLELTRLHCADNNLTELDISVNTKITEILCYNNQLTFLNIANGKGNGFTYMKSYNNTASLCIQVDPGTAPKPNEGLYSIGWTRDLTSKVVADCNATGTTVNIPDTHLKTYLLSLITANGISDYDQEISTTEATALTVNIDLSTTFVTDVTGLEAFVNITYLNCSNLGISTLDVTGMTALKTLYCSKNSIPTLDLTNNTALEELNTSGNDLTALDVSTLTSLKELNTNGNDLTVLNITNNSLLHTLDCSDNNLNALDVSNNTILEYLTCGDNNLTAIDVSHNFLLSRLDCRYNNLTSIDVSTNNSLTYLHCSNNNITSIDISANSFMNNIQCHYNNLTALNIANGYTSNLSYMKAYSNPDLSCIQIDAGFTPPVESGPYTSGWTTDDTSSYNDNCNYVLSSDNFITDTAIKLYPNPVKDIIYINSADKITDYAIYNVIGKLIKKGKLTTNNSINASKLNKGLYIIHLNNDKGIITRKIIKQ